MGGVARILVRGVNWVGDALLMTPALASVRRTFPKAHLSLLVRPWVADLFRGNPAVDEVLLYESAGGHGGLTGKLRLARELRRRRFDLAVLFQNAFDAALIAWLARIPERVGFATQGRGWLLTRPVSLPPELRRRHQVEYYLGLVRALGWSEAPTELVLSLSTTEQEQADALLREAGCDGTVPIVALNPGAVYGSAKRWPAERYAALADRLAVEGYRPLLVGAPSDAGAAAEVRAAAERPQALADLTGRTGLKTLAALLRRCSAFVSNDTGAMHVAAAAGTPLVAIFGPTDPATTAPVSRRAILLRRPVFCSPCLLRDCPIDHRCMRGVSVDEVHEALLTLLRHSSGSAGPLRERPAGRPAVILDRDGTINEELGYIGSPEQVRLIPGAAAALRRLQAAGFCLVIVTNQSGVARGYFDEAALQRVNGHLLALLSAEGVQVAGVYYCPHHPTEGHPPYRRTCECRKPGGGLIRRAAEEHGLDLARSFVIGDHLSDVLLGRGVGSRTVLLLTGHGREEAARIRQTVGASPDCVAADLVEAATWILTQATSDVAGARPAP
ncbi:MAG TPA: lipopolysaccharide heptosyltransferase II [Candidatus Methylomirabilis sp.]|nr:lipopolysaccharide heptosyltransferase II [Candidatus Methylomirabilis sp.]